MGKRVNVDGVSRAAPGLELLGHFLGVGEGEDAHFGSVLERVGEMIEQMGHSIGETDKSEDTGAQKRVAAKGVEKRVVEAGDVGVDPGNIGELLDCKLANRTFLAFSYPL